jgi:hypothetical protein
VAVAVLALLGGAGLALYALGWLLVPGTASRSRSPSGRCAAGQQHHRPRRVLAGRGRRRPAGLLDGARRRRARRPGRAAYLVARDRREGPPRSAPPLDQPFADAAAAAGCPRERSPLGGLTLSAAALVVGRLLLAREAGSSS